MLATILRIKISVTLVLWSLPLLLLPAPCFVRLGMPEPEPLVFLKLLGAAYLALVVGYAGGLRRLYRGDDVRNIVWVGIASNGSSSLILLICGIVGAWSGWGIMAQTYMWTSLLLTTSITLLLVVAGLFRNQS